MSEILNNISKMTTNEIVAAYTKDEIWQAFKEAQAVFKSRAIHTLYQLYMAYDSLSQYELLEGYKGLKGCNLSTNNKTPL